MIKYHLYNDNKKKYLGEYYSKREVNQVLENILKNSGESREDYRIEEEVL